jgi:hypothetical protein
MLEAGCRTALVRNSNSELVFIPFFMSAVRNAQICGSSWLTGFSAVAKQSEGERQHPSLSRSKGDFTQAPVDPKSAPLGPNE